VLTSGSSAHRKRLSCVAARTQAHMGQALHGSDDDVMPCSLVRVYRRFVGTSIFRVEERGKQQSEYFI
jgi:hypothetical protein